MIASTGNPLSRMTVASLADLGYRVDLDAAERFVLPRPAVLAEAGRPARRDAPLGAGWCCP